MLIAPFIPPARSGGRPRSTDTREVYNAIFYITRGGCARRLLPHESPKWQTVYHYYRRFRLSGLWAHMHRRLRDRPRQLAGRDRHPTAVVIDSRTVKTTERGVSTATTGRRGSTAESAIFSWTPAGYHW